MNSPIVTYFVLNLYEFLYKELPLTSWAAWFNKLAKQYAEEVTMHRLVLYLLMPPILILFVAGLTLLGGMRLAYLGDYPDPFAPFESMMPGQSISALEVPPCSFQSIAGYDGIAIGCEIHPMDGPFVSVSSSISNGRFVYTSFSAHNLYFGDIVRHWGRPDVVVNYNHRSFQVIWKDQGLIGFIHPVGVAGQFNYLQPVQQFAIGLESRNLP
jgi:hypothetical protein